MIDLRTTLMTLLAAGSICLYGCSEEASTTHSSPESTAMTENTTQPVANFEIPDLGAELEARKAQFSAKANPTTAEIYEQGIKLVEQSGVLDTAINVGDQAPDFTLPNATENDVTLSELLKNGPVVLVWYRGGWCPYCNIQLSALRKALPAFEAENAQIVAISPELPDKAFTTTQKNELPYEVLSDVGNKVAADFGVVFDLPEIVVEQFKGRLDIPGYNGDDSWTLPLSATYIIDTDGTITYAYLDADYRQRADIGKLIDVLQGM